MAERELLIRLKPIIDAGAKKVFSDFAGMAKEAEKMSGEHAAAGGKTRNVARKQELSEYEKQVGMSYKEMERMDSKRFRSQQKSIQDRNREESRAAKDRQRQEEEEERAANAREVRKFRAQQKTIQDRERVEKKAAAESAREHKQEESARAKAEKSYERASERQGMLRIRTARAGLHFSEQLLHVGKNVAQLGIMDEKDSDKLLRNLAQIEFAFDAVGGGMRVLQTGAHAWHLWGKSAANAATMAKSAGALGKVASGTGAAVGALEVADAVGGGVGAAPVVAGVAKTIVAGIGSACTATAAAMAAIVVAGVAAALAYPLFKLRQENKQADEAAKKTARMEAPGGVRAQMLEWQLPQKDLAHRAEQEQDENQFSTARARAEMSGMGYGGKYAAGWRKSFGGIGGDAAEEKVRGSSEDATNAFDKYIWETQTRRNLTGRGDKGLSDERIMSLSSRAGQASSNKNAAARQLDIANTAARKAEADVAKAKERSENVSYGGASSNQHLTWTWFGGGKGVHRQSEDKLTPEEKKQDAQADLVNAAAIHDQEAAVKGLSEAQERYKGAIGEVREAEKRQAEAAIAEKEAMAMGIKEQIALMKEQKKEAIETAKAARQHAKGTNATIGAMGDLEFAKYARAIREYDRTGKVSDRQQAALLTQGPDLKYQRVGKEWNEREGTRRQSEAGIGTGEDERTAELEAQGVQRDISQRETSITAPTGESTGKYDVTMATKIEIDLKDDADKILRAVSEKLDDIEKKRETVISDLIDQRVKLALYTQNLQRESIGRGQGN